MAREPKIAYVMLRNAHFGPLLAASVELCVRDLVVHSRYARSTLVVCPPVDEPFEDIEIPESAAISEKRGASPSCCGAAASISPLSKIIYPRRRSSR
jgi:hypothetical protein